MLKRVVRMERNLAVKWPLPFKIKVFKKNNWNCKKEDARRQKVGIPCTKS